MGKSILIIDDDRDFRNALKHVFECHHYRVFEACNGKEGVALYRRFGTDIVLTDIFMPERDGLEAVREIKKEFPEAKIVTMSGIHLGNTDFLQMAKYLGAIDSIRKPFEPDEIIRIVGQALDNSQAIRSAF